MPFLLINTPLLLGFVSLQFLLLHGFERFQFLIEMLIDPFFSPLLT